MIDERMDHLDVDLLDTIGEAIVRNAYFHITQRCQPSTILTGKANHDHALALGNLGSAQNIR